MKNRHNLTPKRLALRSGFTLIELLVVVGIALLVTTFTVLGIDFAFETERVRGGSRQLQSMLAGARDRAIFAREPRGVRFLLDNDPLNGRKISSMIYIGAGEKWREGTITLKRPDFVDGSGNPVSDNVVDTIDFDNDGMSPETELFMIEGSPETLWGNLLDRGYLPPFEYDTDGDGVLDPSEDTNSNGVWDQRTARIKIPGDKNGTWYTVSTYWLSYSQRDPAHPNRLQLMTQYRDPGTTPSTVVDGFEDGAGPTSYILELPPRVLPDAEPILLPEGVVIDLDGSHVPASWRPPFSPGLTAEERGALPYSNRMDLLFSPRGTVTGPEAAMGLIHFYLTLESDVDNSFVIQNRQPLHQLSPRPLVPADGQFVDATTGEVTPVGDRALVSVFTQTGKISAFPLVATDVLGEDLDGDGTLDETPGNPGTGADLYEDANGDGNLNTPDGFADDPFQMVTRGRGLTQ